MVVFKLNYQQRVRISRIVWACGNPSTILKNIVVSKKREGNF